MVVYGLFVSCVILPSHVRARGAEAFSIAIAGLCHCQVSSEIPRGASSSNHNWESQSLPKFAVRLISFGNDFILKYCGVSPSRTLRSACLDLRNHLGSGSVRRLPEGGIAPADTRVHRPEAGGPRSTLSLSCMYVIWFFPHFAFRLMKQPACYSLGR